MDAIRPLLVDFWNHALVEYRTWLIKAESKRRKAIADIDCRKASRRLCDQNQAVAQCRVQESHSKTTAAAPVDDVSTIALSKLGKCDRSEMKRVFDLFDENKDGHISAEELQAFMNRLGFELSDQKVKDMVGAVDKNRDDRVDFEEFFSLHTSLLALEDDVHNSPASRNASNEVDDDEEATLLQAFFVFDENKDGLITALELQQVLLKLGLPEGRSLIGCQKMIERVDVDGNGKVDFFEFKNMMCSDAFSITARN